MFLMNSSTSYTFLATVFFLLLVSSSIVLRSYILRRRFRRRYEHALANGVLTELDGATLAGVARNYGVDGPGGGFGRARRLGAKPLLWETWVLRNGFVFEEGTDEKHSSPDTQQNQLHTLLSRLRLRKSGSNSSRPSSSELVRNGTDLVGGDSGRDADPEVINAFSGSKADTLSVSVLIAMPDVSAPAPRPLVREGREEGGKGKDVLDSHSHSPTHPHQQLQNRSEAPSPSSLPHGPIPSASEDGVRGLPLIEFGIAEVEAVGIGEVIR
ncbi:hypothetical protein BDN67DRAFT_1069163 [Paxillus ammoniavirescens]|nr:hypothetical protein BDN67DRAFT_1069163 [Paxillus ammoniavirescens]